MTFAQQAITDTIAEKNLSSTVRGQQRVVDQVTEGVQQRLDAALDSARDAAVQRFGVQAADVDALLIEAGLKTAPMMTPQDGGAAVSDDRLARIESTINQLVDVANQRAGARVQRIG